MVRHGSGLSPPVAGPFRSRDAPASGLYDHTWLPSLGLQSNRSTLLPRDSTSRHSEQLIPCDRTLHGAFDTDARTPVALFHVHNCSAWAVLPDAPHVCGTTGTRHKSCNASRQRDTLLCGLSWPASPRSSPCPIGNQHSICQSHKGLTQLYRATGEFQADRKCPQLSRIVCIAAREP